MFFYNRKGNIYFQENGVFIKGDTDFWNHSFSHFRPHFSSETTNFLQLVTKNLGKKRAIPMKPHAGLTRKPGSFYFVSMKLDYKNGSFCDHFGKKLNFWAISLTCDLV